MFVAKLRYLLSPGQKVQLVILGILLFIGMLFEMAGLGVLIPALGIMLNPDIGNQYPFLKPLLRFLGNPTQVQLVIGGMGFLVFVYLLKALFLMYLTWRQSKFSAELSADLSKRLFIGYLHKPYTFHLQKNSAELLRNVQTEVGLFLTVSQNFIALSIEFTAAVGISFMLFFVEPLGATVVTSFLILSAFAFHRVTKNILLAWGEKRQFHDGKTNQHLIQGLSGVKDVKVLGREENFLNEFDLHNNAKVRILTKQNTLLLIPRFYLELLAVIGLAGLVVLMIVQKKPVEAMMPSLGVFVAAAFRMIPSVNRIMSSIQVIRYAQPVVDLLYKEFSSFQGDSGEREKQGSIQFTRELKAEGLVFAYPDTSRYALDQVSFCINKGMSVGFIGASGSGKSTLVDIILGLLQPVSGKIMVDGEDIQSAIRDWQTQIGYVPQSIYLTDDTLRRNVAFGIPVEKIDEKAVLRAISAAQLENFINDLPEGLDTIVGERGVRLSGGQRQRIGIARALYHDPSILVLDEATSALDSETETGVMQAVDGLKGQKTLFIVAHRLSTVSNCDLLVRLEHGRVVEQGTPQQLLNKAKQNVPAE